MSTENQTEKKPSIFDPKSNLKALVRIIAIVFVLAAGAWLFIRFTAGEKAANKVANTILQRPMELKNAIENLPASSMKGIALSLPYSGTVTIEATAVKGNEVDVYVVKPDQIENVKNKKQFSHLQGFEATKTRTTAGRTVCPKEIITSSSWTPRWAFCRRPRPTFRFRPGLSRENYLGLPALNLR